MMSKGSVASRGPAWGNVVVVADLDMRRRGVACRGWLYIAQRSIKSARARALDGMPREVLFNGRAGSFEFSEQAIAEYLRRGGRLNGDLSSDEHPLLRDDPIMISVVHDLGRYASGASADILVASVPAPFETHFGITEYGGREIVRINYPEWFTEHTHAVLRSRLSAHKKVRAIAALAARKMEAEEYVF